MKRPVAFAVPIIIVMIVLIIPLGQLALGGISEKYLPPDNSVRQAQEEFDKTFPGFRTEPLTLVIQSDNGQPVTDQQIAEVRNKAMQITGFTDPDNDPAKMWQERPYLDGASKDPSVTGDPERPGEPQRRRQEDRGTAGDPAAARGHRVGRRHARAGTGQYPQPVRQAAADGRCC